MAPGGKEGLEAKTKKKSMVLAKVQVLHERCNVVWSKNNEKHMKR